MGGHHRSVVILDFFIFCLFLAIFWSFLHFWGILHFWVVLGEPVSYEITRGIGRVTKGVWGGGFGKVWGVWGVLGGHSEPLRQSDMGSVQNLIGMPSNGFGPKVAVQNIIAMYNFFFKKNIWAKYWWRILCFYHSIHKWFKNIFNHTALPSMWNFTLVYAVTLNTGHQCPLVGSFFTGSFPQFWNTLWPWLQRYLPDGDVNTHFQILIEPL